MSLTQGFTSVFVPARLEEDSSISNLFGHHPKAILAYNRFSRSIYTALPVNIIFAYLISLVNYPFNRIAQLRIRNTTSRRISNKNVGVFIPLKMPVYQLLRTARSGPLSSIDGGRPAYDEA